MKTLVAALMLALVLAPGLAGAEAEAHLFVDANGETHTVDAYVADDGTATLLVDGQPPALP